MFGPWQLLWTTWRPAFFFLSLQTSEIWFKVWLRFKSISCPVWQTPGRDALLIWYWYWCINLKTSERRTNNDKYTKYTMGCKSFCRWFKHPGLFLVSLLFAFESKVFSLSLEPFRCTHTHTYDTTQLWIESYHIYILDTIRYYWILSNTISIDLSILYIYVIFSARLYHIIMLCYIMKRLDYSVLHRIIFHCIVLYCIVLYCIVLYCIVLYCIVLYCSVLYCIYSIVLLIMLCDMIAFCVLYIRI